MGTSLGLQTESHLKPYRAEHAPVKTPTTTWAGCPFLSPVFTFRTKFLLESGIFGTC